MEENDYITKVEEFSNKEALGDLPECPFVTVLWTEARTEGK
jgi:hypothetical protein